MINQTIYAELVSQAKAQDISRHVAAAVIYDNGCVLLLQRPQDAFMGGIYEIPGGKVEKGEELDQALTREVVEETSLQVSEICQYLGSFDYLSNSGKKTRQFNFYVKVKPPLNVVLQEHTCYDWVRREDLPKYRVSEATLSILDKFWSSIKT